MSRALKALVVACAVAASTPALAAPPADAFGDEPRMNTITIEPLALILARTVSLEYERAIIEALSIYLAPSFTVGGAESGDDEASFFAIGAALGLRVYLVGRAPEGLFVGAFGELAWATADNSAGDEASAVGWGTGALVGYTWVLADTFALSIGGGAAYHDVTVTLSDGDTGIQGFKPLARLAIGVAF